MRDALMIYLIVGELAVLCATVGPGMRAALERIHVDRPNLSATPRWFRILALFIGAMITASGWLLFAIAALCIKIFGRGRE